MSTWTLDQLTDQTGRTVVVTGPTIGGIGYFTALELARGGARVVLAGRTQSKLAEAAKAIASEVPDAQTEQLVVDLASFDSIHSAAQRAERLGPIHTLINNAGIMAVPFRRTADGLESQLATNHFGPFLLTGLLLPQLIASDDARVVTVSSPMHRMARKAPLDDPAAKPRFYSRWGRYAESKLANLLFTFELDRRLEDRPVRALAAHPGFAATHLVTNGQFGRATGGVASVVNGAVKAVAQPAAMGALPSLMAATADLPGSTYCGPSGLQEMRGLPHVIGCTKLARDPGAQEGLWELSEKTTGLSYP